MTLADRLTTQDVAELAVGIQQISAPTFAEYDRARAVHELLVAAGLEAELVQHADVIPNVYARLPGEDSQLPALLISAHTDTVFPAATDLTVTRDEAAGRIAGPGIGDNSLAVAALVAVARALAAAGADRWRAPCDIYLVANAGEEGLGNLGGVRAAAEHLEAAAPGGIGAAVVLEGMALGKVYHRAVGSRRYRLTVEGPGGHSWGDYGTPSAVHELIARLGPVIAMEPPASPRTTFNVGTIAGGTSINTIAASATADVDLRSESPEELERLEETFRKAIAAGARANTSLPGVEGPGGTSPEGLSLRLELIGDRPAGAIPPDHPLVGAACAALESAGIVPELRSGSTDVNALLAAGVPAVCVGVSTGGGAHRLDEFINTGPVNSGMRQLGLLIPEAALVAAGVRVVEAS